jgi:hypothetical protein
VSCGVIVIEDNKKIYYPNEKYNEIKKMGICKYMNQIFKFRKNDNFIFAPQNGTRCFSCPDVFLCNDLGCPVVDTVNYYVIIVTK